MHRILVINPGSTSTKVAVFEDKKQVCKESIAHDREEIAKYENVVDQLDMRRALILEFLARKEIPVSSLSAIAARGGVLPPVKAGAYKVNDDMLRQLRYRTQVEHASNLGGLLADAVGRSEGIPSYVYDPITVDEMEPIAKIVGWKGMRRKGMGHNLNMRAVAIRYAEEHQRAYADLTMLIAHLGGGISLSLHQKGKIVDMISDDEGPFSPERAGGLPIYQVLDRAYNGQNTYRTMMKTLRSRGGLLSLLGTTDALEVERRIAEGDEYAALVYEAMAHNIAKNIGKLAVVTCGDVDAIILTGGIAHSKMLTDWVIKRVKFIAPVAVMPGENEMEALAFGCLRVLNGEEEARDYVYRESFD